MNILTPLSPEYKNFIKKNKDIVDVNILFKGYVDKVLSGKEDIFLDKQDFKKFESHLKELKDFQELLNENGIKIKSIKLVENLYLLQENGKNNLLQNESIREFLYWGLEKNLLFLFNFDNFSFNDLLKFSQDENISYLMLHAKSKTLNVLFKIKDFSKKDFVELANNPNFFNALIFKRDINIFLKLFELENFSKPDLLELLDNPKIMELIYEGTSKSFVYIWKKLAIKTKKDFLDNIDLFLQNSYVFDVSDISLEQFDYEEIRNKDFLELAKYKNDFTNDKYVDRSFGYPFSIIDKQVDIKIKGKQEKGSNYILGDEKYFDINEKEEGLTKDEQLLINRIFAPIMPMTRVLRLINGKTQYVSIDVENDKDGIELSMFDEETPKEIIDFYRMLYQFITLDFDRWGTHNLTKQGVIYDFDWAFNKRISKRGFDDVFKNKEYYPEMLNIFKNFKNYIHSELNELLKIYKKRNSFIAGNNVLLLEKMSAREKAMTFKNFIYGFDFVEEGILDFIKDNS